ncbi:MAG: ComF family protein [Alteromonadaceae bacterium]|jgi:ComF family protein
MLEKWISFINKHLRLSNIIQYVKLNLSSCDLCGQPCQTYPLLCEHCYHDLSLFKLDTVEGDLLNWPAIDKALPKHAFDQLICLAPYLWPFTLWMTQLKYQGRFEISELFAQLLNDCGLALATTLLAEKSPIILAVPLHSKKWQSRGFNQAHLIAHAFSKLVKIPYQPDVIIRTVHTDSQVGQSGGGRRKNLRNAFSLHLDNLILPEHIILIDDVVTTGSTANEICRLLKKHGVKRITLLSVCLSLPK